MQFNEDGACWSGIDHNGKRRVLVGQSVELEKAMELVERVADSDVSVLIQGENGTGKELIARAIHGLSPRKNGPFTAIHCASVPETLLESELFGFEQGSFTGAMRRKIGKFELANGGTLFLDEVGEAPLSIQVKLLRALQEREIERLGAIQPIPIDVHVISATNKDLREEVSKGNFRKDLYYRLATVPIYLPPLRDRKGDIPLLVEYFVKRACEEHCRPMVSISDAAMQMLKSYAWPGNVRELENVITRAVVLQENRVIEPSDLWLAELDTPEPSTNDIQYRGLKSAAKEAEKALLLQALEANQWNKTRTAGQLGISYRSLMYKIKEYELREFQRKSEKIMPFSSGKAHS